MKETVDLTQKRAQENSQNDGKQKPAGDGYITGIECKQFRWNVTQQEAVSNRNEEKGMDSIHYIYIYVHIYTYLIYMSTIYMYIHTHILYYIEWL